MPSGKTHDRITLWCFPWVILLAQLTTRHWGYTLLIGASFLFAGLMFGPDLDIRSIQSKRWGWLRWLWFPYRGQIRHRSWLSHGFLAGTVLRLIYLFVWILLGILLVLEFSNTAGQTQVTWNDLGKSILTIFLRYWRIWVAIAIGIEMGAMSHSLSDWTVSSWKRQQRRGKNKTYTRRRK